MPKNTIFPSHVKAFLHGKGTPLVSPLGRISSFFAALDKVDEPFQIFIGIKIDLQSTAFSFGNDPDGGAQSALQSLSDLANLRANRPPPFADPHLSRTPLRNHPFHRPHRQISTSDPSGQGHLVLFTIQGQEGSGMAGG
jgi:hypothetical protein